MIPLSNHKMVLMHKWIWVFGFSTSDQHIREINSKCDTKTLNEWTLFVLIKYINQKLYIIFAGLGFSKFYWAAFFCYTEIASHEIQFTMEIYGQFHFSCFILSTWISLSSYKKPRKETWNNTLLKCIQMTVCKLSLKAKITLYCVIFNWSIGLLAFSTNQPINFNGRLGWLTLRR